MRTVKQNQSTPGAKNPAKARRQSKAGHGAGSSSETLSYVITPGRQDSAQGPKAFHVKTDWGTSLALVLSQGYTNFTYLCSTLYSSVHVEVREQLVVVSSLLPLCTFHRPNCLVRLRSQIKHFHCPSYQRDFILGIVSGGPRQLMPRAPCRDTQISQSWLCKPVIQASASAGGAEQTQGLPELHETSKTRAQTKPHRETTFRETNLDIRKSYEGAGEKAQQVTAFAGLVKDLNSVPNTHVRWLTNL